MVAAQHRYRFKISLPAYRLQEYYRGAVSKVLVITEDGLRLELPLSALRPFIRRDGVYGRFEARADANARLVGLERLDERAE